MKRKLVVVSNREPWLGERSEKGIKYRRTVGGLVSSLDRIMQSQGGRWIAWGSGATDFLKGDELSVPPDAPKYKLKRIRLTDIEVEQYYHKFSNRTLWPIFHLFPERARFTVDSWEYYKKVNEKFANAVLESSCKDNIIWLQDYHLALTSKFIREKRESAIIGMFWHIPWVGWEIFSKIPWRKEILEGLLGNNLLGFHTSSYVSAFFECAEKLGFGVDRKRSMVESTKVKAFPIGIETSSFRCLAPESLVTFRGHLRAEHIILGVDRLDYTKGLTMKILAFERFLKKYPYFRGKATLVQIITPSRIRVKEYREMKKELDENIGRINGEFQKMNWLPIKYFYRSFSQKELLKFYGIADIALITPLKDGMNLVAKEYVCAREEGVLILSEFTGVSEEFGSAIIVNPYNIDEVADSIDFALRLLPDDRRERFEALKNEVKRHDIQWWLKSFLRELEKV